MHFISANLAPLPSNDTYGVSPPSHHQHPPVPSRWPTLIPTRMILQYYTCRVISLQALTKIFVISNDMCLCFISAELYQIGDLSKVVEPHQRHTISYKVTNCRGVNSSQWYSILVFCNARRCLLIQFPFSLHDTTDIIRQSDYLRRWYNCMCIRGSNSGTGTQNQQLPDGDVPFLTGQFIII